MYRAIVSRRPQSQREKVNREERRRHRMRKKSCIISKGNGKGIILLTSKGPGKVFGALGSW